MRRFLALLFCVLLAWPSQAAVTANSAVTPQTPKFPHLQITNANGTTAQTLYACGANGTKILGMMVTSTDTAAREVVISVLNGGTTYSLTRVAVAIQAGSVAGTPPINLMSPVNWPGLPIDSDGNPFFFCASGDTLQAAAGATLTAATFLNVLIVGADF